jgi:hypothetical protein
MKSVARGMALAGVIVVALVGSAAAQLQAEVARLLRVEWAPLSEEWTRPRLVGHVYNDSIYRIGSVRLRLQSLDASDQVLREDLAWIYVDVPARGRAYFSVNRPAGAQSFRVSVESFLLISRERLNETP